MHMTIVTEDHDLAVGARLSGILSREVNAQHSARDVWNVAISDPECSMIYLSSAVAKELGDVVEEFRAEHTLPIVVVLPFEELRRNHGRITE